MVTAVGDQGVNMKRHMDLSRWRSWAGLSVGEVSLVTGLSTATLYRMIRARQLDTVRVGRRVLIRPSEIERMLQEGKSNEA